MAEERKQISLRLVLEDLSNGITRKEGDIGYDAELGSIQEKYGMTKAQVDRLFKHPKLKGKKTRRPQDDGFDIVDDTNGEDIQTGAKFGERSATSALRGEKEMEKAALESGVFPD